MKISLLIVIGLYCLANLFAGLYDLFNVHILPITVDIFLILSGLVFLTAIYFIWKERKGWFWLVIISLVIASLIALYNERILDMGHPTHHIYRGAYTLVIFVVAYLLSKKSKNK